jgi:hypothetical protein
MLNQAITVLSLLLLMLQSSAYAQTWQSESGDMQAAVVELFVSEGCGQCPPAERWSHELPELGFDRQKLIALTFHVDYLNEQKGWVDRFATPLFSERQKQLARLNLYRTVFTPGVFIGGEIVHNWRQHGTTAIEFINDFEAEADIKLQAEKRDQQLQINTHVSVTDVENRQYGKVYLAMIEDNIISEIGGGDNIGAVFNHQNLVRRWLGPFDLNPAGSTTINTNIMLEPDWKLNEMSLVAVVQNLNDGYVLQGLSMPLTEK